MRLASIPTTANILYVLSILRVVELFANSDFDHSANQKARLATSSFTNDSQ